MEGHAHPAARHPVLLQAHARQPGPARQRCQPEVPDPAADGIQHALLLRGLRRLGQRRLGVGQPGPGQRHATDRGERRPVRGHDRRQRLLLGQPEQLRRPGRGRDQIGGVFGPPLLDRPRTLHPDLPGHGQPRASCAATPRTRTSPTSRRTGPSASRTAATRRTPTAASWHLVVEPARAPGTRSTPGGRGSTCCRRPGPTPTAASTTALYEVDAAYHWTPSSAQVPVAPGRPGRPPRPASRWRSSTTRSTRTRSLRARTPSSRAELACRAPRPERREARLQRPRPHLPAQQPGRGAAWLPATSSGGGGAKLQSVHEIHACSVDAYAIGWSNTNSTGTPGRGLAAALAAQVFHFLKVTVSGTAGHRHADELDRPDLRRPDLQRRRWATSRHAAPDRPERVAATAVSSSQVNVSGRPPPTTSASPATTSSATATSSVRSPGSPSPSPTRPSPPRRPTATRCEPTTPPAITPDPSTGVNVTTPAAPGTGHRLPGRQRGHLRRPEAPTTTFGAATSVFADTSPAQRGFLKFAPHRHHRRRAERGRPAVRDRQRHGRTTAGDHDRARGRSPRSTGTTSPRRAVVADLGNAPTNTFIDYPVTPVVTGNGTYGFELLPQSSNGLGVASREATNAANRPQLRVTFLPALRTARAECARRGHGYGGVVCARERALVSVLGQRRRDRLRRDRNGACIASVSGSTLTYADAAVAPSTAYSYQIVAKDLAGNASAPSTASAVTTPAPTGPTTLQFVAVEDTYTDLQAPSTNFGTAPNIFSDTSPVQQGYLRFNVDRHHRRRAERRRAPVRHRQRHQRPGHRGHDRRLGRDDERGNEPTHGAAISDLGNAAVEHVHRLPGDRGGDRQRHLLLRARAPVQQRPRRRAGQATTAANRPQLVITYT